MKSYITEWKSHLQTLCSFLEATAVNNSLAIILEFFCVCIYKDLRNLKKTQQENIVMLFYTIFLFS